MFPPQIVHDEELMCNSYNRRLLFCQGINEPRWGISFILQELSHNISMVYNVRVCVVEM